MIFFRYSWQKFTQFLPLHNFYECRENFPCSRESNTVWQICALIQTIKRFLNTHILANSYNI